MGLDHSIMMASSHADGFPPAYQGAGQIGPLTTIVSNPKALPPGVDRHSSAAPYVLVVEDNAINQAIALEFLAALGVRTQVAMDGEEALVQCEREAPDLILMDIQMPVMDGLEATRRLRLLQAQGRMPSFPIVALSAFSHESDRAASRLAGMDEHLVKPVDLRLLQATLRRWIALPQEL